MCLIIGLSNLFYMLVYPVLYEKKKKKRMKSDKNVLPFVIHMVECTLFLI